MVNCGHMIPAQKLEADVAHLTAPQAEHYPFVEVKCPAIPALVDGQAVRCTAAAADGRTWAVTTTEVRERHPHARPDRVHRDGQLTNGPRGGAGVEQCGLDTTGV